MYEINMIIEMSVEISHERSQDILFNDIYSMINFYTSNYQKSLCKVTLISVIFNENVFSLI